jgi:O-antigen ligase
MHRPDLVLQAPLGIALIATVVFALVVPLNFAFNVPPSSTVLNQALAWVGWGAVAAIVFYGCAADHRFAVPVGAAMLMAALSIPIAATLAFASSTGLPFGLMLSISGTAAAACLVAFAGGVIARNGFSTGTGGDATTAAFCWSLVIAGSLGALVALVQTYAPQWADGEWIAIPSGSRAGGNLRQPNHLATLLLWAAIALVWLGQTARSRANATLATLLFVLMLFVVVLTASRTSIIGVLLLAVWGAVDRALPRGWRWLLFVAPLLLAVFWWLTSALTTDAQANAAASDRLSLSSSRSAVWSNTLSLIHKRPWFGVGMGEYNFAWTLTPFADRSGEFFDHSHNLPLQFIVELGWPLGALVIVLLALSLGRAASLAYSARGAEAVSRRCLLMVLLLIGLHSMLEYPLWYAHFLFPTALAWGMSVGSVGAPTRTNSLRWLPFAAALAMSAGGLLIIADYTRVTAIFAPADDAPPLAERIAEGRQSWFFAHHADYALVTSSPPGSVALAAFDRPVHYLLDRRLMTAWIQALAAHGQIERATYIACRLAEFPGGAGPSTAPPPADCEAVDRKFSFDDFR